MVRSYKYSVYYINKVCYYRTIPKYQAWKTNYLLGLLDVQTAGDYFSKSAVAAQSEDYTTALTYLQQGNTLFQRSNHYLSMADESIPE
jgi:hypothetical protein